MARGFYWNQVAGAERAGQDSRGDGEKSANVY